MFSDETWPKTVDVSMLRKLTSMPLSWRMGGIVGPVTLPPPGVTW